MAKTTDERKHDLRAAVQLKVDENREQAWRLPGGISYSSYDYHAGLLWKIIDSLVDECAETKTLAQEEE